MAATLALVALCCCAAVWIPSTDASNSGVFTYSKLCASSQMMSPGLWDGSCADASTRLGWQHLSQEWASADIGETDASIHTTRSGLRSLGESKRGEEAGGPLKSAMKGCLQAGNTKEFCVKAVAADPEVFIPHSEYMKKYKRKEEKAKKTAAKMKETSSKVQKARVKANKEVASKAQASQLDAAKLSAYEKNTAAAEKAFFYFKHVIHPTRNWEAEEKTEAKARAKANAEWAVKAKVKAEKTAKAKVTAEKKQKADKTEKANKAAAAKLTADAKRKKALTAKLRVETGTGTALDAGSDARCRVTEGGTPGNLDCCSKAITHCPDGITTKGYFTGDGCDGTNPYKGGGCWHWDVRATTLDMYCRVESPPLAKKPCHGDCLMDKPDATFYCTTAGVTHVQYTAKEISLAYVKRVRCKPYANGMQKCSVFKVARCINHGKNIWTHVYNDHIHNFAQKARDAAADLVNALNSGRKCDHHQMYYIKDRLGAL